MRRLGGMFGTVVLGSTVLTMFALGAWPAWAEKPGLTASPDPLVFPGASTSSNSSCPVVASGPGAPSPPPPCSYAVLTVDNEGPHAQSITNETASSPFFSTPYGTCDTSDSGTIPKHSSCTVVFGFGPTSSAGKYEGKATLDFQSGTVLTVTLEGSSTSTSS